jgi:hypothetical protein
VQCVTQNNILGLFKSSEHDSNACLRGWVGGGDLEQGQQEEEKLMAQKRLFLPAALCCAGMLSLASVARADVIMNAGGWVASTVNVGEASIVVDAETSEYIVIQISKDFTDPPDEFGNFPGILIDFVQADPNAVPRIIIADESITNFTGVEWTDYHWQILDGTDAWFNQSESAGWTVDPFTNKTWTDIIGVNMAQGLDADGGVVPDFGASFFPGGSVDPNDHLVIDINLTGTSSFTFKQFPTPEPATLTLLALGGAALLRRRVR